MYALSMYDEYINDILTGKKPCDVRLYPTDKRGKIALLKTGTDQIYGYVILSSVLKISYEDYVYWHISDKYTYLDASNDIKTNYQSEDRKEFAYMYVLEKPVLFSAPKRIKIIDKDGPWIRFNENEIQCGYEQQTLF